MMYTYNGRSFMVNLDKLNFYNIQGYWYNPRNGDSLRITINITSGKVEFDPPGHKKDGNDWVLVLKTA